MNDNQEETAEGQMAAAAGCISVAVIGVVLAAIVGIVILIQKVL